MPAKCAASAAATSWQRWRTTRFAVRKFALTAPPAKAAVADQLEGKTVKKVIVVKGRLVNIAAI